MEDKLVEEYFNMYPSEVWFKDKPTIVVHVNDLVEKVMVLSMNKDGLVVTSGIVEFGVAWECVQSPYKLKLISYAVCGTL